MMEKGKYEGDLLDSVVAYPDRICSCGNGEMLRLGWAENDGKEKKLSAGIYKQDFPEYSKVVGINIPYLQMKTQKLREFKS